MGRDSETGKPRWQTIRLNGKLHSPSDDQPAKIIFDDQGRPERKEWFHENLHHRISGPALLKINPNNNIVFYEEHRCFGKMHRSWTEPAWIERDQQNNNGPCFVGHVGPR